MSVRVVKSTSEHLLGARTFEGDSGEQLSELVHKGGNLSEPSPLDLDFHFEPATSDGLSKCDKGVHLKRHACEEASKKFRMAVGEPWREYRVVPKPRRMNRLAGCILAVFEQGWFMYFNPGQGREMEKDLAKKQAKVCSELFQYQAGFFHRGHQGASCGSPSNLSWSECLVGGMQIMMESGNPLRFGAGKDRLSRQANPPVGCNIRKDGTLFFREKAALNETNPGLSDSSQSFAPVCGQYPWGIAPALAVADLAKQSKQTTSCDAISFHTCCERSQCNSCKSRRRNGNCPWFSDLACCRLGAPCGC